MSPSVPPLLASLRGRLIVSCQAPAPSPLRRPDIIAALAECAVLGGAAGIRIDGPDDVAATRARVRVPIVGLFKQRTGSPVYITPTFEAGQAVARAGAAIVAVQATRERATHAEPLGPLIERLHAECRVLVMADVSTRDEGMAAEAAGADVVATTMAGYTPHSRQLAGPDLELVEDLAAALSVPLIAEGRIHTPEDAAAARRAGAWAVVVGRAITMPQAITERFARAVEAAG
ncbi:MAG TPA: putative N-acetylmannosamine-6-phosphate 2-epimerase [bacterium]|nr:putative N-acetylmannosamine-6-phosphate 2-epimerase [bacterium]